MIRQNLAAAARDQRDGNAIPATVVQERISGFDADGNIVFGPSTVTKAAVLTFTVPVAMTSFRIDFLDKTGAVLYISTSNVTLVPGVTVTLTNLPLTTPPGNAATLAFAVQPSDALTAQAIRPPVAVQLLDAKGNVAATTTASVTIALGNNPSAGVLGGTLTRPAVNGVATFADLTIDQAGTGYTLVASSTNLTDVTSTAFNETAVGPVLPPASLNVSAPANAQTGSAFTVTVSLLDTNGKVVSTATDAVTISFANDPSGGKATLGGTKTVNAVGGVATFSDLTIDRPGHDYALKASSGNLATVVSQTLRVAAGTISFSPATATVVSSGNGVDQNSTSFALADFNQDGNLDVVIACPNSTTQMWISILYGNGDGTFTEQQYNSNFLMAPLALDRPGSVVVGKFSKNNPNYPDIAFPTGNFITGGKLVVMSNNGAGSFDITTFPMAKVNNVAGYSLKGTVVLDVNNDGALDIAVSDERGNLQLFINDGNGNFTAQAFAGLGVAQTQSLWAADFDGDGHTDLVSSDFNTAGSSVVYYNTGDPTGFFANTAFTGLNSSANRGTAIADINGDGKIDYLVCENNNRKGDIFINNGDRTFTKLPQVQIQGINPQGMTTADINQDGVPDLIYGDQGMPTGYLPAPATPTGGFEVWPTTLTGTTPTWSTSVFVLAGALPINGTPTGQMPVGVLSGDFNNDGLPDVITLANGSGNGGVSVYLNTSH